MSSASLLGEVARGGLGVERVLKLLSLGQGVRAGFVVGLLLGRRRRLFDHVLVARGRLGVLRVRSRLGCCFSCCVDFPKVVRLRVGTLDVELCFGVGIRKPRFVALLGRAGLRGLLLRGLLLGDRRLCLLRLRGALRGELIRQCLLVLELLEVALRVDEACVLGLTTKILGLGRIVARLILELLGRAGVVLRGLVGNLLVGNGVVRLRVFGLSVCDVRGIRRLEGVGRRWFGRRLGCLRLWLEGRLRGIARDHVVDGLNRLHRLDGLDSLRHFRGPPPASTADRA